MSEFRRAKRRKVEDHIEVADCMTERVVGHLSDLSETGMLLIANQPLMNDALYQLRFTLPEAGGRGHAVEVGAHELWLDEAAAPGQTWVGLRFVDIAPADLLFLRSWVGAPDSEQA